MYDSSHLGVRPAARHAAAISSLLGKVAVLVSLAIGTTAIGVYTAIAVGAGVWPLGLVGSGVSLLLLLALRGAPVVNLILMYSMSFFMGLLIGPAVDLYFAAGQSGIVLQAVGTTAFAVLTLSGYGLWTNRDFSGLGPYLFVALVGLIVAGFAQLFFPAPVSRLLVSSAGAVIFSLYLVYDLQQTRTKENTEANAVLIAVDVYLDILNLFLHLLRLVAGLSSDDD